MGWGDVCHPERSGVAAESKDLHADMTALLKKVRRSFDSRCLLRMKSGEKAVRNGINCNIENLKNFRMR